MQNSLLATIDKKEKNVTNTVLLHHITTYKGRKDIKFASSDNDIPFYMIRILKAPKACVDVTTCLQQASTLT